MSNETTLKNLNTALQMELTAAHQYQLHAHVLDDWGLDLLADQMREEFAEETAHSDKFLNRIFDLGGEPEVAFASRPHPAKTLKEMFETDLADEKEAIVFYTKAAKAAYDDNDLASKSLFEAIAIDEEGHRAWLEMQLNLIERIGLEQYSAKFVSGAEGPGD